VGDLRLPAITEDGKRAWPAGGPVEKGMERAAREGVKCAELGPAEAFKNEKSSIV
jgi:hypothetical protein